MTNAHWPQVEPAFWSVVLFAIFTVMIITGIAATQISKRLI